MVVAARVAALLLALPGVLAAQNVAEVQVAPPSITLKVGERAGLLATAFDRVGNVIPTVRVLWSSNNLQVARVDNSGTVTGIAGGGEGGGGGGGGGGVSRPLHPRPLAHRPTPPSLASRRGAGPPRFCALSRPPSICSRRRTSAPRRAP